MVGSGTPSGGRHRGDSRGSCGVRHRVERDHWDSDGWRILRHSGVHRGPDGLRRPVSVVFAVDANAAAESVSQPVVRVSVVDEERQEAVADPVLEVARRPLLPMATPGLNAG